MIDRSAANLSPTIQAIEDRFSCQSHAEVFHSTPLHSSISLSSTFAFLLATCSPPSPSSSSSSSNSVSEEVGAASLLPILRFGKMAFGAAFFILVRVPLALATVEGEGENTAVDLGVGALRLVPLARMGVEGLEVSPLRPRVAGSRMRSFLL